MEVALITPMSMQEYQQATRMQLILPHIKHPEYWQNVRDRQGNGDFLILDNGAAEGVTTSPSELARLALQYQVNEVALPDKLGNRDATIDMARTFFDVLSTDTLKACQELVEAGKLSFGYVTQGNSLSDVAIGISRVMRSKYAAMIKTMYIPRLLVHRDRSLYTRIDIACWIHQTYPSMNVHMFGASTAWPREVLAIAKEAPFVRSIDTSMPMNFALAGMRLDDLSMFTSPPPRRSDFFEWEAKTEDLEHFHKLAEINVRTYLQWAHYYD